MKANFPIEQFRKLETPFYYYDTNLLRETLNKIKEEAGKYNKFCVHYAVKANANPKILGIIRESGLGADCVSGGEIKAAIKRIPCQQNSICRSRKNRQGNQFRTGL